MPNCWLQSEQNCFALKPNYKWHHEWAAFKTSEHWQLTLWGLLAPNVSFAHWCSNPWCKASVHMWQRVVFGSVQCWSRWSITVSKGHQTELCQGQDHGIRSRDYHSSVSLWDYTNNWHLARQTTRTFIRLSSSLSCSRSSTYQWLNSWIDALLLQEFKCDTNSVFILLEAMSVQCR